MEDGAGGGEEGVGADEDILANYIKSEKVTKFYYISFAVYQLVM